MGPQLKKLKVPVVKDQRWKMTRKTRKTIGIKRGCVGIPEANMDASSWLPGKRVCFIVTRQTNIEELIFSARFLIF